MIRLPRMRATHLLPRLTLTLALVAAFGFGGAARAAPAADAATLAELQRQLAQVQAALQQLSDENRALREHEKQIDQQLAQLSAQASAAGSAPALAAVPAAGANAAPPPPANASALPAAGTPVSTSLGPVGSAFVVFTREPATAIEALADLKIDSVRAPLIPAILFVPDLPWPGGVRC